jgi:transcriptional regulator with XRE-family HTH domain
MVALPFCYLTLKTPKPRNPAYPEHLKTLGDHIRTRRLDLGIHQKDVAAIVNATTSTVTNWEKNRTSPTLEFLPRILSFLGYDPSSDHAPTLGEKIKRYRRINGLSIKKLAQQLGIDQGTLARWEKGQAMHSRPFQRVLISLLKNVQ